MASGAPAASLRAKARASSSTASSSLTKFTRPRRWASSAVTGSPVSRYCFAIAGPTAMGQITVPPSPATIPTRTCGSSITALLAMKMVSVSSAMEAPSPAAAPFKAQTIGNSTSSRSQISCFASRRRCSSALGSCRVGNQSKSPPALNARPEPVSSTARAPSSCLSSRKRRVNSSCRTPSTAFITLSGWSMVIFRISPSR